MRDIEQATKEGMKVNDQPIDLDAKGLRLEVLRRADGNDCTNGGLSAYFGTVTLVGTQQRPFTNGKRQPVKPLPREAQVFSPSDDAPAVVMVESNLRGDNEPYLMPLDWAQYGVPSNSVGPMAGGNFATTSDSRFGEIIRDEFCADVSALRIHDRVETPAQYRNLSY